ncbi:MAG: hypothetical protein IJ659_08590 [Alloprevotella sp.]|nr:hypothetical protein [Alloprevotella sp.]
MRKDYMYLGLSLLLFMLFLTDSARAQMANHCLRFSEGGEVDCGPMPELDGLNTYTVQFWMCADEWTEGATLLSRGEDFRVGLGAENTLEITAGGKTFTAKRNEFQPGRWLPIMIQAKPTRTSLSLSNTLVKAASAAEPLPAVGARFVLGGDKYKGRLDEVRVWNAELSSDYDYFTNNTLNKWAPQLGNLVAYFKCDQPWCENIVDYKALFAPRQKTNHHGIPSATGVAKERVTDNEEGLPYLLNGAYTNNARFYDGSIEKEKYLLSNDLIILGIQAYDDGHLRPLTPCDHGTVRNGEYIDRYKSRIGVLSLSGTNSYMLCPESAFTPWNGYTIETWIYLDEWTEGAYIFRKENTAKTKGFSIRLGEEASGQVIVRINGKQFFFQKILKTGSWQHLCVMRGEGTSNTNTVLCFVGGVEKHADATLSDNSTDGLPTGMDGLKVFIGQNLRGELDETAIWHTTFSTPDLDDHRNNKMPMPGLGKRVSGSTFDVAAAYYRYNDPDNLGWDYYSQDEWKRIMESAYDGCKGYQIRISVQGNGSWMSTISDASRRKIFAADLAELSKPYDGVELDLEWMEGTQTNLGLLADEILKVLPEGKTLMISQHPYGAYKFPTDKIQKVDGYTFQLYGNSKEWFTWSSFENSYNSMKNYGYTEDKMYFSYSTTTSGGYNESGSLVSAIAGLNWGFIDDKYVPATDGSAEEGIFDGQYYYFHGPAQVYKRAKFVREHHMMGIFYWDMCNDLSPSHKYSLARNCSYALCANVDPYVEEAVPAHPTGISSPSVTRQASLIYDLQGRRISEPGAKRGVFIQNGRKILR